MLAYVGGYTTADRGGRAPGITVFRLGLPGERWTALQVLDAGENPSLLRFGPGNRTLYAVHGARTDVSAYAVDPATGLLAPAGRVDSGGVNPVDLGVWPGRSALLAVHYTSGTAAVLPLRPDGAPDGPAQVLPLRRDGHPGPSMPHGVAFDPSGRFALVPDKGLDCVWAFALGADNQLVPAGLGVCGPGSGPRHCAFHPTLPILYVVNELGCSVQSFRWQDGALDPLQVVSSLPPGAAGVAAEIAVSPDGRSLYASNRGHDTIAHFAVDAGGLLGPAACTPCGGAEPRLFALSLDGRVLHVCCQDSHRIVSFPLDAAGRPAAGTVAAEVGSPTALCFRAVP
jgi:6-phosphogluconolactonase